MVKNLTLSLMMLAAAAAPQMVAAQDLLAEKPIHTLGEAKTWTSSDGAEYTFITDDLSKLVAVPTNTDNVYLFPEQGGGWNTPENQAIGIQGFYVDMETEQEIGIVRSTWEGASAKNYNIYVTNTLPTPAILETTPTYSVAGLEQYTENLAVLPEGTKGRYLVFQSTDAINWGWGVKIRSISALAPAEDELTEFAVSPGLAILNTQTPLSYVFKNQNGLDIDASKVNVTVSDNAVLEGNLLTITSGTEAIITAAMGDVALTATVYAVAEAPGSPAASLIKTPIFTNTVTEYNSSAYWMVDYNGKAVDLGTLTFDNGEVARQFSNTRCVFLSNTVTTGGWNEAFDPTEKGYRSFRISIFGSKDAQGNIYLEGSELLPHANPISVKAGEWADFELVLTGETKISNISIRFDEANMCDVLFANIYYTPAYIEGDEEAPILSEVTAEADMTSATLKFSATDDLNPTIIYSITDGVNTWSTTGTSGEDVEYVVTGLNPLTEYNFTVTASDGKNISEPKSVSVKTTGFEAAPTPEIEAEKVVAVYSSYYGATELPHFDNWGSAASMSTLVDGNGDTNLRFNNYNGQWGGIVDLDVDVKNMQFLHIDIYGDAQDGKIELAPVWKNAQGNTPNKLVDVEANTWNSFDLSLSDFNEGKYDTVVQFSMAQSSLSTFVVNNFYFYSTTQNGIDSTIADANAPVEYYTLQGLRANGELAPGIYLRRQGDKVVKILVK